MSCVCHCPYGLVFVYYFMFLTLTVLTPDYSGRNIKSSVSSPGGGRNQHSNSHAKAIIDCKPAPRTPEYSGPRLFSVRGS